RGATAPAAGGRRPRPRGAPRAERSRPRHAAARRRRAGDRARRDPPTRPRRELRRGGRAARRARGVADGARGARRRDAHHGRRQGRGVPAARGAPGGRRSPVMSERLRVWLATREGLLFAVAGLAGATAVVLAAALALHTDLSDRAARVAAGERDLAMLRRLAADLGPAPATAPARGPSLSTRP